MKVSIKNLCRFCAIAQKEAPAYILYEDEQFVAFLDIKPQAVGHTLVISKVHQPDWLKMEPVALGELVVMSQKVGRRLQEVAQAEHIFMKIIGVDVLHVHVHLVPDRFVGIEHKRDFEQIAKLVSFNG